MLRIEPGRRIWLCTTATDMRKSFDGLAAEVRSRLGEDPVSGHWFAFINRRWTQIKVLAWFQHQVFGEKSEKRLEIDETIQPSLLAGLGVPDVALPPARPEETVTYARRPKVRTAETVLPAGLRFTDDAVIEELQLDDPAFEAIPEDQKERIGEKVTYRLAQRPSSYSILKLIRPVYRLKASGEILCAETPPAVFPGCTADVSVLAGLMINKGRYHLPIYRQHQRMTDGGLILSRQTPLN